jgi:phage terminase small subunit
MAGKKLTPKQKRFVAEYLIDLNATAAAIRAGYAKKTANKQGPRLLVNVGIAEAIAQAMQIREKRTEVTQDAVINELRRIAFLDPRRVITWGPDGIELIDSSTLTEDEAACVVEASETITESGGTKRIKLADKIQALTLLGKHLGMFVDRHEHSGKIDVRRLSDLKDAELEIFERILSRLCDEDG